MKIPEGHLYFACQTQKKQFSFIHILNQFKLTYKEGKPSRSKKSNKCFLVIIMK